VLILGFYISGSLGAFCQSPHAQDINSLPFSEGGIESEDSGVKAENSRYIDSVEGNDNWLGSKEQPWKTLNNATSESIINIQMGEDHISITKSEMFAII